MDWYLFCMWYVVGLVLVLVITYIILCYLVEREIKEIEREKQLRDELLRELQRVLDYSIKNISAPLTSVVRYMYNNFDEDSEESQVIIAEDLEPLDEP